MIHINHLETLTDLCGILKVRREREREVERGGVEGERGEWTICYWFFICRWKLWRS